MNRRMRSIIAFMLLTFSVASANAASLFVFSNPSRTSTFNGTLVRIDPTSGMPPEISGNPVLQTQALAFHSTNNLFYSYDNFADRIYTIDPTTGVTSFLTPNGTNTGINTISSLSHDSSSNTLFGLATTSSVFDELISINTITGIATTIGQVGFGFNFFRDLAYDSLNDKLFGISESGLYEINRNTGAGTFIGHNGISLTTLAYDSEFDRLISIARAGRDSIGLYELNSETGAATFLSNTSASVFDLSTVRGLTYAPSDSFTANPIPIPASVWLFGSAIGMLGWYRKKATT